MTGGGLRKEQKVSQKSTKKTRGLHVSGQKPIAGKNFRKPNRLLKKERKKISGEVGGTVRNVSAKQKSLSTQSNLPRTENKQMKRLFSELF